MMGSIWEKVVKEAWKWLLNDYKSGSAILRLEADMERHFTNLCRLVMKQEHLQELLGNQEVHLGKRVDVRVGPSSNPILVQLKLYHDRADWKETAMMKNTVESDLNFAQGRANVWVGIIDVIPSSPRHPLPFDLKWETLELDDSVFREAYSTVNPRTSPARELIQKALLVQGSGIQCISA